jgi:hypothetical protein
MNYKGVTNWIGLPISVDGCLPIVSVVSLPSVDSGFYSPHFTKASVCVSA